MVTDTLRLVGRQPAARAPRSVGAPASSPEGTLISLTGSFTDPGTADTHTQAWAVTKNGSPYASGSGASFSFTPDDNGSYVATYTVTDDDNGVGTDTKTINVTNENPVASISGAPASSPEGTLISLTGSFTDPGSADTHTQAWNVTKNGSPYASGNGAAFSFTPDDNGSYVATYTVTDDDNGSDTDTESDHTSPTRIPFVATLTSGRVRREPPASPATVHSTSASATRASNDGPWAVDVDWGDGTSHTPFNAMVAGRPASAVALVRRRRLPDHRRA